LPPVPYIAHVCREAREVVMRLGVRLNLAWTEELRGQRSEPLNPAAVEISPAGFLLRNHDIVLHMPDPTCGSEPELDPDVQIRNPAAPGEPTTATLTHSTITPVLQCNRMAVNWAPPARQAGARAFPGSVAPKPWFSIKSAGPTLRTVDVFYRSRFLDVILPVDYAFFDDDDVGEGAVWETEMQLMVDLYDDARLAELHMIDMIGAAHLQKLSAEEYERPRFAVRNLLNPGLCLNCERANWERHVKPAAIVQWLQLFEDELDEETYRSVFTMDDGVGYVEYHPWVKEKLQSLPEFRPVILMHLRASPVDSESDRMREEQEYGLRVTALR